MDGYIVSNFSKLFLLPLILFSCVTTNSTNNTTPDNFELIIGRNVSMKIPLGTRLFQDLKEVQRLTISRDGKTRDFTAVLAYKARSLQTRVFLPGGVEIINISLNKGKIKSTVNPLVPKHFNAEYLLTDLLFIYSNFHDIEAWSQNQLRVEDSDPFKVRSIYSNDGHQIARIIYQSNVDGFVEKNKIINLNRGDLGYHISITTLEKLL